MTRKTKVRIVGDPSLAVKVLDVLGDAFMFDGKPQSFSRPVGRDTSHSNAPGCTIYVTVKRPKEGAELKKNEWKPDESQMQERS